ncbi:hypothetical protein FNU76_01700 [Chitinimonas arctica]|uniref:Uncharacterized protein n=1 Tax=Chitinimonas arctica TaxID=2594795 RepID=A0A516SAJ8_9NEIS|nr:hypothetical protein [Chitinimonas arctica]QDQ25173.1 hypothetical protein FNU76_01700 [Chitinimonas arctica]
MKEELKNFIIDGRLSRVIRGEEFIFKTSFETNAKMQPTDHNEFLAKGIYPLCNELGNDNIRHCLETGLMDAASDALGVYCAVQCYYIQIISEREKESPFNIDRLVLPRFLGEQFKKYEKELLFVRLNNYDPPDAPLRLTSAAMNALQRDAGIYFT